VRSMSDGRTQGSRRLRSLAARAEQLGVSTKPLLREIDREALPAHKLGRQWRVADDDLEEYLCKRRKG